MRILHTADWHLGCTLGQNHASRTQEHAAFLQWLLATIQEQGVEVLLVAGDIFDQAQPSAEAQQLYYDFLGQAARLPGLRRVVITGGNHDSATRLDAPDGVLRALQVSVVGGYSRSLDPARYLVPIAGDDGQVKLVVAAVPYVNEWRLGQTDQSDAGVLMQGFTSLYSSLADAAKARWPEAALVATGHLTCARDKTIVEGHASDEDHVGSLDAPQEIHRVGTLGALPPSIFDQRYQYVALGHIHRGFPVERPRVWYSGTPVAVNFAEGASPRRVLLVDVQGGALQQVTPLVVPCTRQVIEIRGDEEKVKAALRSLQPVGEQPALVSVILESDKPALGRRDAMVRFLEQQFPDEVTRPLLSAWQERRPSSEQSVANALRTPAERPTPEGVFRRAWIAKHGAEPDVEIMRAFHSLLTTENL